MYQYPKNLYTDVRIETVSKTNIQFENGELKENKTVSEKGAMVRIYDGKRWYYSATTDLNSIQNEIDDLAEMAVPNSAILQDSVVDKLEINRGMDLRYQQDDVSLISNDKKKALVKSYLELISDYPEIRNSKIFYLDNHTVKHFVSGKGADITFDTQNCTIVVRYTIMANDFPQDGQANIYKIRFHELAGHQREVRDEIEKDLDYAKRAVPVKPGVYTCILSPLVAGVFAHESFGHKSEADFMIGDEEMRKEWVIGKKVGASLLNIIDSGQIEGSGYVPYDDEGCRAKKTYLIKDGVLSGRLHSAYTAALLNENPTANARAISFEYEPIVRMTTTYIDSGKQTKEELFGEVEDGIFIDDFKHGSGMSTFTIAPSRAYRICHGKIAEPLKIAVITGNVMKTLHEIDGVSDAVEIKSFGTGGCGKMEQYPLRVGFGGPYVRVNGINVQ